MYLMNTHLYACPRCADKLINNAEKALARSETDWSKNYWHGVWTKLREKYNTSTKTTLKKKKTRYNKKKLKGKCEFCNCEGEEVHHLSPQELADVNKYISTFHKDHPGNLANICKKCHVNFTIKKIIHKKTKTTEGYKLVEQ